RRQVLRVQPALRDQGFELAKLLRGRVAAFEPSSPLELAHEGEQSAVGVMRRAKVAQCGTWLVQELVFERERNVRLADAGLPGKHHHAAFALRGLSPPA